MTALKDFTTYYNVRGRLNGLAFDPLTGELWDTENGPNNYDEINLVTPGFNSGGERIMGPVNRDAQGAGDLVQFPGRITLIRNFLGSIRSVRQ
jgi:aldose sugar dehydrogenase